MKILLAIAFSEAACVINIAVKEPVPMAFMHCNP